MITKKYCIDCGKLLYKLACYSKTKRCKSCGAKFRLKNPANHPRYKDGRNLKKSNCIDCGKKTSHYKCIRCCDCYHKYNTGKVNPMYIDGRTSLTQMIRDCDNYKNWHFEVFKRNNYTCQLCGKNKCYLTVDHIKPFSIILNEFLSYYNMFSPIEDKETLVRLAITWSDFWNINNGQTLCKKCHKSKTKLDWKLIKNFRSEK